MKGLVYDSKFDLNNAIVGVNVNYNEEKYTGVAWVKKGENVMLFTDVKNIDVVPATLLIDRCENIKSSIGGLTPTFKSLYCDYDVNLK
ncbi:hypothetical protein [Photobacterium sanguinicancri]|uniref:hypothetical protein n=1 Tax=Photobacterium sanguinicancri TaxID=875932 RepID=UPI003D0D8C2D